MTETKFNRLGYSALRKMLKNSEVSMENNFEVDYLTPEYLTLIFMEKNGADLNRITRQLENAQKVGLLESAITRDVTYHILNQSKNRISVKQSIGYRIKKDKIEDVRKLLEGKLK